MAVALLILGILALATGIWSVVPVVGIVAALLGFFPAVLAAIFGHVGLKTSSRNGIGKGQALSGLMLGYGTLAIIALIITFWFVAQIARAATSVETL